MNFCERRRNSPIFRICLAMIVAGGLSACTPAAQRASIDGQLDGRPEPRSLGSSLPSPLSTGTSVAEPIGQNSPDEPVGEITLRTALAQALLKSPELAVFSWEMRSANARILQAGVIPNPELGLEVENFGGSAMRNGFRGAESTVALSQLIELGGKREKRTRVASLERDLSGWDYEAKRLDVYVATAKAFVRALAAQRRTELRQAQLALANQVLATVDERVKAGRASPLENVRASVALEASRVAAHRAARELHATRNKLVAQWGSTAVGFTRVSGELDELSVLPPLEDLIERVSENPDLARAEKEFELRRSNLALARANDIPDITISAGVRRYEETDDGAFIAGISIPIPVFGVNPGGVLEADRRLSQQKYRQQTTAVSVIASLQETYAEAAALQSEILALKTTILPGAQKAFEAAQLGYRQGKFDFLEVLDSQRTFFGERERYLDTTLEYHRATLDIERLTGQALVPAAGRAK